jgi:protein tyrosine phosphatase
MNKSKKNIKKNNKNINNEKLNNNINNLNENIEEIKEEENNEKNIKNKDENLNDINDINKESNKIINDNIINNNDNENKENNNIIDKDNLVDNKFSLENKKINFINIQDEINKIKNNNNDESSNAFYDYNKYKNKKLLENIHEEDDNDYERKYQKYKNIFLEKPDIYNRNFSQKIYRNKYLFIDNNNYLDNIYKNKLKKNNSQNNIITYNFQFNNNNNITTINDNNINNYLNNNTNYNINSYKLKSKYDINYSKRFFKLLREKQNPNLINKSNEIPYDKILNSLHEKTKLNFCNSAKNLKYNNNNNNINIDNYINASYIDGPLKEDKKLFIATQGPLSGTIFSFWKMIISHNINLIIMLSNVYEEGREKSECYWPTSEDNNLILYKDNDNEKKDINDKIVLKLVKEEILENNSIVKRTFKLNELKEINQIQILCWGDHDIPKDNLIFNKIINLLINKINDNRIQNPEIPILIHCSAGVGRTGTFIDICQIIKCLEKIKILKKEPILNVFNVVRKLREQRYSMVTDTIQYKSIYTLCINWIKENIYKNIHNIEYNLHK